MKSLSWINKLIIVVMILGVNLLPINYAKSSPGNDEKLTRDLASKLIRQSGEAINQTRKVYLHPWFEYVGILLGMWNKYGDGDLRLTVKGRESFNAIIFSESPIANLTKEQSIPAIEVTGITDNPSEGMKIAEFSWKYINTSPAIKRFVVNGGLGKASIKLYDDGWRLVGLDWKASIQPMDLTAQEQADQDKEIQEVANHRNALLHAATTNSRTLITTNSVNLIGTFNFKDILTPVVVSDTDITFDYFQWDALFNRGEKRVSVKITYMTGISLAKGQPINFPYNSKHQVLNVDLKRSITDRIVSEGDEYPLTIWTKEDGRDQNYTLYFTDKKERDRTADAISTAFSEWNDKYSEVRIWYNSGYFTVLSEHGDM